jgi:hypothetical protein
MLIQPIWPSSRHCETLKGLAPRGAGAIGLSHVLFENICQTFQN